jgi:hypothetical protein
MSADDEIRDNSCNWCRASAHFWRNVTLIAVAHVALIVGLIRWSVAARASTNAENIVWLGEDLAAGQSENEEAPSVQRDAHPIQPKPLKDDQAEEESGSEVREKRKKPYRKNWNWVSKRQWENRFNGERWQRRWRK